MNDVLDLSIMEDEELHMLYYRPTQNNTMVEEEAKAFPHVRAPGIYQNWSAWELSSVYVCCGLCDPIFAGGATAH